MAAPSGGNSIFFLSKKITPIWTQQIIRLSGEAK
ncbi:hypothetical protein J2S19_001574 [Metabacillus malikii]|uniref:Uncharacterized protein n=1 Tax=Metabacillus malikii TaxID=1504265 RepID=A0ABT9ZDH9_9BACI|nr:hypothetical protein [Metabacillus malikii]